MVGNDRTFFYACLSIILSKDSIRVRVFFLLSFAVSLNFIYDIDTTVTRAATLSRAQAPLQSRQETNGLGNTEVCCLASNLSKHMTNALATSTEISQISFAALRSNAGTFVPLHQLGLNGDRAGIAVWFNL